MSFQVGDRVRQVRLIGGIFGDVGAEGTVRAVDIDYRGMPCTVVEFDERVAGGWDCYMGCDEGHGLMVHDPSALEPIAPPVIGKARSFGEFVRAQERLAGAHR